MSGHKLASDRAKQLDVGTAILDPGENGIVDLQGLSGGYFTVTGNGDRLLPDESKLPLGTIVFIVNIGSSEVFIKDYTDTQTRASILQAETAMFVITNKLGAHQWGGVIFKVGA